MSLCIMTKIAIITQGCSANAAESEIMAGLLKKADFEMSKAEDADLILINTCTVKGEFTAIRAIKHAKTKYPNKKIIVAGCVTKRLISKLREVDEEAGILNTHNLKNIVSVVEETINDSPIEAFSTEPEVKLGFPRVRKNQLIGIIPILNSCAGHCTFCSTKQVKGKLLSYPKDQIIAESRKAIVSGCRELWITSQDNGAYMFDKGARELPQLLTELCQLPSDFKIRLGMINPTHIIKMLPELIKVYKNPHMFQFLHVPIQSANNRILNLMKRENTVEEYKTIIEEFKKALPHITIATDIIVGFPTETEQEFLDSVDLIKKTMPDIVNVSRYRLRHGTLASKMEGQVLDEESKKRSKLLSHICENISTLRNESWRDWQGEVMIDENGKNNTWIARNFAYKQIILEGNFSMGEKVNVKIIKTNPYDLRGIIC